MDTAEQAEMAFQYVRTCFSKSIKSTTKGYRSGPRQLSDEIRDKQASENIRNLRNDYYLYSNITRSEYFAKSAHLKTGNCFEMAHITAGYVSQHGGNACVCSTADGSTHAFCIVGKRMYKKNEIISLQDFHEHDGAWIVDPWAGICCPAISYSREFLCKMKKWSNQGKSVYFEHNWARANDSDWIGRVIYDPLKINENYPKCCSA